MGDEKQSDDVTQTESDNAKEAEQKENGDSVKSDKVKGKKAINFYFSPPA